MKTTERFDKAYSALVKAYFDGTLVSGDCEFCAVGNICKEAALEMNIRNDEWGVLFRTTSDGSRFNLNGIPGVYNPYYCAPIKDTIAMIHKTGYSPFELSKVEMAFEKNTKFKMKPNRKYNEDPTEQQLLEDQFKGLCAVVDVLLKLDNITPEDHYKNKFREHPALATHEI